MTSTPAFLDDEIDLRALIRAILGYGWLIVLLPVLLGTLAWAYTRFALPKQYRAAAVILMVNPSLTATLDERVQTNPQAPDLPTLVNLAQVDSVLAAVVKQPRVAALPGGLTEAALRGKLSAAILSSSQISLAVTDSDPQRAAVLANAWAEVVTAQFNDLFGISSVSLQEIETQAQLAYENWARLEERLVADLPQNGFEALEVRLEGAKGALAVYLNETRDIDLIVSDAENLDARLAGQIQSDALRSEDRLALLTLHQRAAGGDAGQGETDQGLLQIQVNTTLLEEGQTVAGASAGLRVFIASLRSQREEIQQLQLGLQTEISNLAAQTEAAEHQRMQLEVQRDLARDAYTALVGRAEALRITLFANNQRFKLASQALPPGGPSGPPAQRNALFGAAAGVLLALAFAILREWWLTPQRAKASAARTAVSPEKGPA